MTCRSINNCFFFQFGVEGLDRKAATEMPTVNLAQHQCLLIRSIIIIRLLFLELDKGLASNLKCENITTVGYIVFTKMYLWFVLSCFQTLQNYTWVCKTGLTDPLDSLAVHLQMSFSLHSSAVALRILYFLNFSVITISKTY